MESVKPTVEFPDLEEDVLVFWESHSTFQKSLDLRAEAPPYMFYDGPPFATGTPHYGHLLAGTIKDIVPRYWSMRGRYVERRFGWDTHGLPIEMLTEKELGLSGQKEILEYGVDRFNEACRSGVLKYVNEWERTTKRLGRWIDFVNDYKTMDLSFMDSVWWVFKQLWDRGRVYEGARVVPFSWRLSTPLSNFEAGSNYKDVQDPAITVRFRLIDDSKRSLLAWTTTPWTLPSNLGLCVGPDIDYVEIRTEDGEQLILAEARLTSYFDPKKIEILQTIKGNQLAGLRYQPLFEYFVDVATFHTENAFRVLVDNYVSTEDGTGIVHQSPAHGEDDYRIGQANSIPLIDPVDSEGNFSSLVPDFEGQNIKEADKDIIRALKDKGLLFKQETIQHSYPFCERSDTPLIYKAISAWYVKVEDLREKMLENNQTVHWIPEHIKEGRFGNWLSQARDWNISRNRYWGNPLPIWRCESCGELECLGSYRELEEKTGESVTDLHKHRIDHLHWECSKCKGQMTRVPEVLDCWFESGSMPYAQLHYPFENKERFDAGFPADFIAEGLDQTRGWFYTLMVLSTILFEKAPFKNVIVNGMILAEDGKKMSKSLKNYPDPHEIMESYGSDALRLYMISSAVVRGESLRFSESGVKEIVRSVLLPYWNVYSFFTTYACLDNYAPGKDLTKSSNILDQWIISRFQTLLERIEKEMNEYRLYAVIPGLLAFLEELTNWYVRRSRRRFWSDDAVDKQSGYETLHYILLEFSKALAPF
ncbi:MAG: isoleucine--tRNA ligase, partial [Bdellovibrionales bacterium]|nr:isoleucine--tRNA ligase [Bdellovibrionales bacterium]